MKKRKEEALKWDGNLSGEGKKTKIVTAIILYAADKSNHSKYTSDIFLYTYSAPLIDSHSSMTVKCM